MRISQDFDYDQPTRDALAGIYVEAYDPVAGVVADEGTPVQVPCGFQSPPRPEDLFGLTLTVDDGITAEQTSPSEQSGDMAEQIKDVPDGGKIEFKIAQ